MRLLHAPARATLAALVLLAATPACRDEAAAPAVPRLTRLDLTGVRGLVGAWEARGLGVDAAGAVAPLAADAWGIDVAWWHALTQDPTGPREVRRLTVDGALLDCADLSPDWALLLLQPRTVPEGLDQYTTLVLAYARPLALLDKRSGAVHQAMAEDDGWNLGMEDPPLYPGPAEPDGSPGRPNLGQLPVARLAASFQQDGAGALHALQRSSSMEGRVMPVAPRGAFPRSALGDDVTSYAFDVSGRLVYAAFRGGVFPGGGDLVLAISAPGQPLVSLPRAALEAGGPSELAGFGRVFRGPDGHAYLTRTFQDTAATTELLRVGADAVAPVASWSGTPGGLTAAPIPIAGGLAFVQDGAVVFLADPARRPAVHPLGSAVLDARPAGRALWLVAADAGGAASGVLRWTPAGVARVSEVAPVRLIPLSEDEALVTSEDAPGRFLATRLRADGSQAPLGLAGPLHVGGGGLLR
jgi:hypothetical protein